MLVTRNQERFRFAEALLLSVSWGVGVAAGVALGGWLTLVGGAGAPGAGGLDPISDLVVLPGAVFAVVVAVQLVARVGAAALRGRSHRGSEYEDDQQGAEDDGIVR